MAFLDNSGDIILDAVLTDAGRSRLAKGDGCFKITKFALGDDEINYELFNRNHASGSAYYDLEILQSPVLEAFTDNAAGLKSKLVSIPRTNFLYLPVAKLNEIAGAGEHSRHSSGVYLIAVDKDTEDKVGVSGSLGASDAGTSVAGIMYGENTQDGTIIRVDQGLDTSEISPAQTLDADLVETQYIVEMDNRFGSIVVPATNRRASVSFIDDDNIASYYFSLGVHRNLVKQNDVTETDPTSQVVAGPRGTIFNFKVRASVDLNTSTYLFNQLGGGTTVSLPDVDGATTTCLYIDDTIRVTCATTGYSLDIPVRFIKKQ